MASCRIGKVFVVDGVGRLGKSTSTLFHEAGKVRQEDDRYSGTALSFFHDRRLTFWMPTSEADTATTGGAKTSGEIVVSSRTALGSRLGSHSAKGRQEKRGITAQHGQRSVHSTQVDCPTSIIGNTVLLVGRLCNSIRTSCDHGGHISEIMCVSSSLPVMEYANGCRQAYQCGPSDGYKMIRQEPRNDTIPVCSDVILRLPRRGAKLPSAPAPPPPREHSRAPAGILAEKANGCGVPRYPTIDCSASTGLPAL